MSVGSSLLISLLLSSISSLSKKPIVSRSQRNSGMTVRTYDLDSLKLSTRDSRLTLKLSSTFSLHLPSTLDPNSSREDLSNQVEAGRLWVARAAGCRIGLSISVDNNVLRPGDLCAEEIPCFVQAFANCPVSMVPSPRSKLIALDLARTWS
jgi:hypothetical protein